MSYCPGEQNPDHHTLHLLTGENRHVWLSSQNVDLDLLKVFPLKLRELNCRGSVSFALCSNIVYGFMRKISKVILYNLKVFLSFTPEHFLSKFFVYRHVIQEKLPCVTPLGGNVFGYSVPSSISQLFQFNVWLLRIQELINFDALFTNLALSNFLQQRIFFLRWFLLLISMVFQPVLKFLGSVQHLLLVQRDGSTRRLESGIVV